MSLDQEIIEYEEKHEEKEMSFLDHVDDLRKHLLKSALAIIFFSIISFIYIKEIFNNILLGPFQKDFIVYRIICNWSQKYYGSDQLCVVPSDFIFQNTRLAGQFILSFKLSFICGIVISAPFILYQIWRFIKPALNIKEKKNTSGFVFYTSFLFLTGILFGYFILYPVTINFLVPYKIASGNTISNQYDINDTLGLISLLVLGTGLIFELPLLMYLLAKIGVLTSSFLKKYRKYAIVIILIFSAIVTPPDVMTQCILAIPLYMLFEIGVIITKRVENKKQKAEDDYQASLK